MVEFHSETGLNVLNQGSDCTFYTHRRGILYASIVDLSLCSDAVLHRVSKWKVVKDDTGLPDHRKIRFRLSNVPRSKEKPATTTRCFDTRKANWGKFGESLTRKLEVEEITEELVAAVSSTEELDGLVEKFTGVVRESCLAAMPMTSRSAGRRGSPWWTEDLDARKRKVKTLRRRIADANPNRRQQVYSDYARERDLYKDEIEKAVTNSWKSFCSQQTREDMRKSSYRVVKRCLESSAHQECLLRSPDDARMLNPQRSARHLAKTYFPADDPDQDTAEHSTTMREASLLRESARTPRNPADLRPFTSDEAEKVFCGMSPNKAPGVDGFTSDICHRVLARTPVLLAIFNTCLLLSHFPKTWKKAWIRIIPKPGKGDYAVPKAYRPIGLLPVMGKVLEKLIFNRLSWELLRSGGISDKQYGFMPQRSTEDALSDALACVRDGLQSKKLVALVSLDIEGAFDCAWWPAIVRELRYRVEDAWIRGVVLSYLDNREIALHYLGETITSTTERGYIQGSICYCGICCWIRV